LVFGVAAVSGLSVSKVKRGKAKRSEEIREKRDKGKERRSEGGR
jgi:hypothetical protein